LIEGYYPATIEMSLATWKRKRWSFTQKAVRAEVTPKEEVYIPGKGTCAHNCGPDATFSSTFPANNIREAITKFTHDIIDTRLKRGGDLMPPEGEDRSCKYPIPQKPIDTELIKSQMEKRAKK